MRGSGSAQWIIEGIQWNGLLRGVALVEGSGTC